MERLLMEAIINIHSLIVSKIQTVACIISYTLRFIREVLAWFLSNLHILILFTSIFLA
jgi:hypothetical protein